MADPSTVVIGYWKGRGYISPIQLMLEYLQIPYRKISHECDPAPLYTIKSWLEEKKSLLTDFDFPNLPYYKDDCVKMTHYLAIMEYLGHKHDLYPIDISKAAMIREQMRDIIEMLINYCYSFEHRKMGTSPSADEKRMSRQLFISLVRPKLQELACIYRTGCWSVDVKLTYIDFLVYDYLERIRLITPEIFPVNLKDFMTSFEQLPTVKSYISSERYSSFPFWPERSYIGREKGDWLDHS